MLDVPRLIGPDELATIATGRSHDLFAGDVDAHQEQIRERFEGRRVLVLGGAGSIGSSTVAALSRFSVAALHVVDHDENALAELVRDLRSRAGGLTVGEFRAVPLDLGSPLMRRFLAGEPPYDCVLNFAALKHVRSEKDVCSVLQMFDTNLLKPALCWSWLRETGATPTYFSVSTDKAADPVNLMGASKRIMEHMMFADEGAFANAVRCTSARFANVAFSNGSLLESFVQRFHKLQPLAAPRDTERFFISLRESGQICLLAAACCPDRHVVIPRLHEAADAHRLEDIAAAFLRAHGYEPEIYEHEDTARQNVLADRARGRYPLLLTSLDTAGEKSAEIFAGQHEPTLELGMKSVLAVRYTPIAAGILTSFLHEISHLVATPGEMVAKHQLVDAVSRVVAEFQHSDRTQSLDQRM